MCQGLSVHPVWTSQVCFKEGGDWVGTALYRTPRQTHANGAAKMGFLKGQEEVAEILEMKGFLAPTQLYISKTSSMFHVQHYYDFRHVHLPPGSGFFLP